MPDKLQWYYQELNEAFHEVILGPKNKLCVSGYPTLPNFWPPTIKFSIIFREFQRYFPVWSPSFIKIKIFFDLPSLFETHM